MHRRWNTVVQIFSDRPVCLFLAVFKKKKKTLEAKSQMDRRGCEIMSSTRWCSHKTHISFTFLIQNEEIQTGQLSAPAETPPLSHHNFIEWKEITWYVAQHLTRRLYRSHSPWKPPPHHDPLSSPLFFTFLTSCCWKAQFNPWACFHLHIHLLFFG